MAGEEMMHKIFERRPIQETPFEKYLRDYILADAEFMAGMRRGMQDRKAGRVTPWSKIKEELGL